MLEFRRASDPHALAEFFSQLTQAGDNRFFHPHPFTSQEAQRIVSYTGRDLYLVANDGPRIIAYGLLRGWDAGFEVPSLGIAVHPAERGSGVARAFMIYLHAAARRQGATRVRLKVYPDNAAAKRLYESLGYVFTDQSPDGQLVGIYDLSPRYRAEAG
ncbi:MAG: GNAT family N-acetyltransferase [Gemmataceae bacterium]